MRSTLYGQPSGEERLLSAHLQARITTRKVPKAVGLGTGNMQRVKWEMAGRRNGGANGVTFRACPKAERGA
jgi:hypothetical protein